MIRPVKRLAVLAAALMQAAWVQAAPLSLDQALALAAQRSTAAMASRAGARGAAEMARAAGQLPDPMLGVSIENLPVTSGDRFSLTRESMTMKRIAVAQEWLSPEKRAAREAAGHAMAKREAAGEWAALTEARTQTAVAYLDAWFAAEALKLTQHSERHAREALETGRARAASPGGSAAETLALTAALGQAEDESLALRQQMNAAMVTLARWTGATAPELLAPRLPDLLSRDAFIAAHPAVAARRADIAFAEQDVVVTRLNRQPNWTWEVSYGQRQGYSDLISFGVRIPLPVAPESRQDRETAAKAALVERAQADLTEAERTAGLEYDAMASDVQRLALRVDRYRTGVLAPARQRVDATLAAYRANQSSLPMVFEARHAELEAQRKVLELQRDLARAQAQLVFKTIDQGAAQ